MVLLLGVEEARRGPVLGPMVMAGVLIKEEDEIKLKNIGAKDSKLLKPHQREKLAKKIKEIALRYETVIISPQEIDNVVGGKGMNLNWLEAHITAKIINLLKPDKVIVDCPSPNIRAYKERILNLLENKKIILIAEHKAEKYPVVAAASIIAKVTGDAELEKIKKKVGYDFGVGYSHDEKTIKFLKEHGDKYPDIIRKSWMTYKNHQNSKKQKKLDEF